MTKTESVGFQPPRWLPHVLSIGGIALTIALCGWQFQRLHWKEDLVARAYEAQQQPEVVLDAAQDAASLPALEYRPVVAEGEFIPGREYHLGGRYLNGKLGYTILAPLQMQYGAPLLLVERGWVPADKKLPETRPETIPQGVVKLHGAVRIPVNPRMFTPDNQPAKNFWFWPDMKLISEDLGQPLLPVILQQVDANASRDVLPVPQVSAVPEFRNDHLGYAITWALMALALCGMYGLWLKRAKAED